MSLFKPVIASDLGAPRELIAYGKNGFLFEADNASALASNIIDVINDQDLLEKVRE